jgi:hypothetical protein
MATAESKSKPPDPPGHDVTIIVNGRPVEISAKELTFEEVVALSGLPTGPQTVFTISYRKGHGEKPEGSMVQGGEAVKVKKGMIFNVDPTDRS